ncbi:MAG: tetratricopeptide repeat protein [Bacteroidetes bacterium]|nr:MAG: tetratricopeptide repeat protein [Bacteroidota bacterium]
MKERIKNLQEELAQPDLDLHRKVDILNELAWFFRASNNVLCMEYTAQANEIASKINYESGLLYVKMMKAFEVYFKGNPADSLMDLQEILKEFEQSEDDKGRGRTMIFMSVAHWSMANYKDGFKYVNEALVLAEETKAEERISWANYILGTFYMDLKDYENSLACLERAMFFFEKTEDLTGKIACMSSIGGILQATGKYEQALKQHQESYDFAKKISQEGQLARALHDIGIVYESLEEFEIALDYLKQSLEIRLKIQNQQGIISCHNNIGRVFMKLNKFEESLEHLKEGEKMCREINAKNKLIPIVKLQADVYKKMGTERV